MSRPIVVLDLESTGLDPRIHRPLEVAWEVLDTGVRGSFLPAVSRRVLAQADPKAMEINGYYDRGLHLAEKDNGQGVEWLRETLRGATLAGASPQFDASMLIPLFAADTLRQRSWFGRTFGPRPTLAEVAPWHYRMLDLSAYAAGVLGLDELPSLWKVCELLDIPPGDHTAGNDVTATVACFKALRAWVAERAA